MRVEDMGHALLVTYEDGTHEIVNPDLRTADCKCGWSSGQQPSRYTALRALAEHQANMGPDVEGRHG